MRLKVDIEALNEQDKHLTHCKKKLYKGGCIGAEHHNFEYQDIKDYHVINEVVIDRGPSPFSIQLEIYIDDEYFTTLVGDG